MQATFRNISPGTDNDVIEPEVFLLMRKPIFTPIKGALIVDDPGRIFLGHVDCYQRLTCRALHIVL
jgi:hypothetical protein